MLKRLLSPVQLSILAVILILAALSAYNVFRVIKLINGEALIAQDVQPAEMLSINGSLSQQKEISPETIIYWHLFGLAESKVVTAPKTTLRLKLIGVIGSAEEGDVRVIIENASGVQNFYKVGDKIMNNVSVKKIALDFVVIEHNSREEILRLQLPSEDEPILRKVSSDQRRT